MREWLKPDKNGGGERGHHTKGSRRERWLTARKLEAVGCSRLPASAADEKPPQGKMSDFCSTNVSQCRVDFLKLTFANHCVASGCRSNVGNVGKVLA
jgi:hypothetical protein